MNENIFFLPQEEVLQSSRPMTLSEFILLEKDAYLNMICKNCGRRMKDHVITQNIRILMCPILENNNGTTFQELVDKRLQDHPFNKLG